MSTLEEAGTKVLTFFGALKRFKHELGIARHVRGSVRVRELHIDNSVGVSLPEAAEEKVTTVARGG